MRSRDCFFLGLERVTPINERRPKRFSQRSDSSVLGMHAPIRYTGAMDDRCPITCVPLADLSAPVAFRKAPQKAYECDALLQWLLTKQSNPLTNLKVAWRVSPL